MHIVLDAMGGDNAARRQISTAPSRRWKEERTLLISLTGPEALASGKAVRKAVRRRSAFASVDAPQVIANDETPVMAVRKKAGFQYRRCRGANGSRRQG